MKNADAIVNRIISRINPKYRKIARAILETRFLSQKNARETAEYLGISYNTVIAVLKEIRDVTKGKTPFDFA